MKRAQRHHRAPDLVALRDVAGTRRGLDQVVHERVDPFGAGRAERLDLGARQIGLVEDAVANRVVDVVVDVRDPVDDADDPPLQRLRVGVAGVREDAVDDLCREIEPARDLRRLLVVAKSRLEQRIERCFARVPERRMAEVVPEPDRLGEILVQLQRAGDYARDAARFERVRHARAVMVAGRVDEDLRLPLQAAERLRVEDAVAVALKRRADAAFVLRPLASARLVGAHGERREGVLFQLARARGKGVANSPGKFGHPGPG